MLPVHLAENIRKQILYSLQSTFDFRYRAVDQGFERFVNEPERELFKGPWVQSRRLFRPANALFYGLERAELHQAVQALPEW